MEVKEQSNMQSGQISYNKNILLSIINLAAKEISGVAGLCSNFGGSKIGKMFSNNYYEGVKITNSKEGICVDIYLNMYSNYNVSDVVCRVQENVKNSIISMMEVSVKVINVHVLGVEFANVDKK